MLSELEKAAADLSTEDLRTLLAFEYWKDGMEEPDVIDLWNDESKTDREIMSELVNVFGY